MLLVLACVVQHSTTICVFAATHTTCRAVEQKDSSWRCGVHPPLTPEEWAAAKVRC